MIMDFNYFSKEQIASVDILSGLETYDCLISAYAEAERVLGPAQKFPCKELWWVAGACNVPEGVRCDRKFSMSEESDGGICTALKENGYERLCIDITGFVVPHLFLLLRLLHIKGYHKVDCIYAEPNQYTDDEDTSFSSEPLEVKQVYGYSGTHVSDMSNDLLVIAAGYDTMGIVQVAYSKRSAKKVLLLGFPPTSPIMFQENLLKAYMAESAIGNDCFRNLDMNIFAPAVDPFATAQAINEFIGRKRKEPFTNVYFSPLSSKPQALGLALYYLWQEGWKKEWSVIYPFCRNYMNDTAKEISKIWLYKVELPIYATSQL